MRPTASASRSAIGLALLLLAVVADASDIVIHDASASIDNGIVMLDANAELMFSDDAVEALQSGIRLIVDLDVRLMRPRRYWVDKELFSTKRRYAIERHALSEQYLLIDLVTATRRVYGSLDDAVSALGELRRVPIVDASSLGDTEAFAVAMRLRLDIGSLPTPMRPIAYVSPSWRMSSGWLQWLAAR